MYDINIFFKNYTANFLFSVKNVFDRVGKRFDNRANIIWKKNAVVCRKIKPVQKSICRLVTICQVLINVNFNNGIGILETGKPLTSKTLLLKPTHPHLL